MINRQLYYSFLFAFFTLAVGTLGYRWLSDQEINWINALYMTVITLSTVGYGEVIDLTHNPQARIFTIVLIFIGMGNLIFFLSSITAFLVEGNINQILKRRNQMKKIKSFKNHYILCGIGRIGFHILKELINQKKEVIVIEYDPNSIDWATSQLDKSELKKTVFLKGDATDETILYKASIEKAEATICALNDDRNNLLLVVTVKNINKQCRILSRLNNIQNHKKFINVGVDYTVSPPFISGLRIASQIIRPTVVDFIDKMLQGNHRISEIPVMKNSWIIEKTLKEIDFNGHFDHFPITIKSNHQFNYNPQEDHIIHAQDVLIFIMTPEKKIEIEAFINKKKKKAPKI